MQDRKLGMGELAVTPAAFAEMVSLIENGTISGKIGKDMLPELLEGKANEGGVKAYVEKKGLLMISDEGVVAEMVERVLAASPKQLEEFRGGKTKLQGFFEG